MDRITYELLKSEVSKERREKASRYVHIEDAYRSICAELLIRVCYSEFTRESRFPRILYERYGKPYLEDNDFFHFNISHSGEWVVIAYGDKEVGIDVEKVSDEMAEIAPIWMTGSELNRIDMPEGIKKTEEITKLWTMKESYLKYRGTGLYTAMKSFGVLEEMKKYNGEVKFHTRRLSGNYYMTVCGADEEINAEEITLGNLTEGIADKRGA